MLPIELNEFLDEQGRSPFKKWISPLDNYAAARIHKYLERLADGIVSNVKGVGKGVNELRVDFGPGYRAYFSWDGPSTAILLGG
jgi:putative addiction module killer protein